MNRLTAAAPPAYLVRDLSPPHNEDNMRPGWLFVSVLVAGLVAIAGVPAADPPGAGTPTGAAPVPAERVTTELVLIETYVTDGRGRPIEGLTAGDFTLLVDGKKVPIASLDFRRIGPGPAGSGEATIAPAGPPQAAVIPRRFMLFFEDGMSAPEGLTAARRAADRFLATGLQPSDEVAIAAYDTSLRILHDFTTDREALRKTLADSLAGARRISSGYAEIRLQAEEIDKAMREYEQEERMARLKAKAGTPAAMADPKDSSGGRKHSEDSSGGAESSNKLVAKRVGSIRCAAGSGNGLSVNLAVVQAGENSAGTGVRTDSTCRLGHGQSGVGGRGPWGAESPACNGR